MTPLSGIPAPKAPPVSFAKLFFSQGKAAPPVSFAKLFFPRRKAEY